jgi:hypothetical protein
MSGIAIAPTMRATASIIRRVSVGTANFLDITRSPQGGKTTEPLYNIPHSLSQEQAIHVFRENHGNPRSSIQPQPQ